MAFAILNMAGASMQSSQLAIEVASQNIASASDANYSRQTLKAIGLSPVSSSSSASVKTGLDEMGVQNIGIMRARSSLLDQNYRAAQDQSQGLSGIQDYLSTLEGDLSGSNDLSALSNKVTQSLATLESNPADSGLRATALQNLQQLALGFQSASTAISSISSQASSDLTSQVDQVNSDLAQLATLNAQIIRSDPTSMGLNQVLDQRDKILDDLSGLISTQIVEQPNGTVTVYNNGAQLVHADEARPIQLGANNTLQSSTGFTLQFPAGGSIGGLQTLIQTTLPSYQQQYDDLASTLVTQLNAIHQVGYGSDGVSGRALFSGTNASNIAVAITDASQLATGVARIGGDAITSSTVASDQSLNSQAAFLTTPATTNGVISVNGTNIAWDDTQSLQTILSSFSAAGVKATFNSTTQSISLARDPSVAGPSTITITDVSGNLTDVLGIAGQVSAPGGSGDNAGVVALVQGLQNTVYGTPATQNFQRAAQAIPESLGQYIYSSQNSLEVAKAGLTSATSARQALSGVNSNQELLDVTQLQNAFQMAAKVATAANELLMTLIKM